MTDTALTLPPLRIGTRGSPLALAQAHETRDRLTAAHPALAEPGAIEIVVIVTTGDRVLDRTLAEAGGKGLFTKEIEEALLDGRIDLAVHSMKDVPTVLPDGLEIAALLPREDPRDAFFSRSGVSLADLPAGSVLGTAGLRRQAQVLQRRPDIKIIPLRGNVQTRLRKLADGEVDAMLLAMAGLRRLGITDRHTEVLDTDVMLPAVAQGAIGIEIRSNDARTRALLEPLACRDTGLRVTAERALLAVLDGSCRTPIAALATLAADEDGGGDRLLLRAKVLSPDGSAVYTACVEGAAADALTIGRAAGQDIKGRLPPGFLAAS
jgi:hydroxymethylbilane synthase